MDERTLTIILRLIHILGGIFWAGAMIVLAGFLIPTVRATGREGARFMQTLMQQQRLQFYLGLAAGLTVLSGITMYVRMAAATHGAWAGSRPGIAYGVGALAAILAAAFGGGISGSAGRKMLVLGQAMGSAAPSVEQQAELSRLQSRMALGARIAASFLVIAASAMAVGRYL
ncbi:MAG: hypothetical protein ACJ8AX_09755 [Gemmatimonadales bacterium]